MSVDNPERGTPAEDFRTLVFRVGSERYGLPLKVVREVFERSEGLVEVPGAPDWLVGVVNHQGLILPLVRADSLLEGGCLSGARPEQERAGAVILLDLGQEQLGLEVDAIFSLDEVQVEGPALGGRRRAWFRGSLLNLLTPSFLEERLEVLLRGLSIDSTRTP